MNILKKFINTLTLFKQNTLGTIYLAYPLVILAYFSPEFFATTVGQVSCALFIGAYIIYISYRRDKALIKALQFAPSGIHKATFDALITECGLSTNSVQIRYAYSNEGTALCSFDTVCIDPLLLPEDNLDPEALKAKQVLETYIVPQLSGLQKQRLALIKQALTPEAHRFIIKHEFGHAVARYSYKKLLVMGITASLMAYIGILTAVACYPLLGIFALPIGMLTAMLSDTTLTYLTNVLFKYLEEKRADQFAARHSNATDIVAAADFFEKHQEIINTTIEHTTFFTHLPSLILSGHPNGFARARYLRKLAASKLL